jgi:hypothetical protein
MQGAKGKWHQKTTEMLSLDPAGLVDPCLCYQYNVTGLYCISYPRALYPDLRLAYKSPSGSLSTSRNFWLKTGIL